MPFPGLAWPGQGHPPRYPGWNSFAERRATVFSFDSLRGAKGDNSHGRVRIASGQASFSTLDVAHSLESAKVNAHFNESWKNLTKSLVCKDLQQFHTPDDGATRQDSAKPSAFAC
jgi:hypothetical protein